MECGHFNSHHAHCLKAISEIHGFSSTIILGKSVHTSMGARASTPNIKAPDTMAIDESHIQQSQGMVQDDTQEDLEAEEDEEDSTEEISQALCDVLRILDNS
jgi:hypothetical protein